MVAARKVVLCADDYGLTEGVSRGILELLGRGSISATSVMSNMPAWGEAARELAPFRHIRGIGLHLNFTTGKPLGAMPNLCPAGEFPSLQDLVQRSFTGRLSEHEIGCEIERQIDAFVSALGQAPDFVDGHQHVHVLPVMRQALLSALSRRGFAGEIWLRDPTDGVLPIVVREVGANKALMVKALALGFRRAAGAAGFETNDGFSGFGPLDPVVPAERVLTQAFTGLGPRPVVMCHPGHADETLRALDPAVESRPAELAFLLSERFGELLAGQGIELVPRPA
jgi:predicted glycoside hydrolase/deacetylase ChbG (UPF0249 family)